MCSKYVNITLLIALWLALLGDCSGQRVLGDRVHEPTIADLYLTVNARHRTLELNWRNFDELGNYIVLTDHYPVKAFEAKFYYHTTLAPTLVESSGDERDGTSTTMTEDDGSGQTTTATADMDLAWEYDYRDQYGQRKREVLYSVQPMYANGWTATDIKFNFDLMNTVTITTSCYGYYAYFIGSNGTVLDSFCMKLYPTWMNDLRDHLANFRVRELFLPGTHDSASFKKNFDPSRQETIVSKYSLTQDDNVRAQLLLGARYIDLRVGYYKTLQPQFWANHGISRMHPLRDVLLQIKEYAEETKEVIVVDVQEFPIGFRNGYDVHMKLIELLHSTLKDVLADSGLGWTGTLGDIWAGGKTVILGYDHEFAIRSYPHIVWQSVEQRWGNVQNLDDLKSFLLKNHRRRFVDGYFYRPIADMAELTPDPWGVITDRYGGLRKMADSVNRYVSQWYFEELGPTTNVVAVDFIRGTSIIDAAIYWNLKRVPNVR